MVLKIYQNANSPQGCGLYFAKYSPQPASNIPHGEFLSTVNLNFVPQRNNSTANIRIQHMYVRSGLRLLFLCGGGPIGYSGGSCRWCLPGRRLCAHTPVLAAQPSRRKSRCVTRRACPGEHLWPASSQCCHGWHRLRTGINTEVSRYILVLAIRSRWQPIRLYNDISYWLVVVYIGSY